MTKTHVIDGVTYVETDRRAKVGDKITIVDGDSGYFINGDIFTVTEADRWPRYDPGASISVEGVSHGIYHREYRVLEPVEDEVVEASPNIIDLLTSISRKIVSLESQLRDTQGNVEKLSQELANARHRIAKHADRFAALEDQIEMLTDDIVTLDSRSQVLNAINKYYAEGSR